MIVAGHPFDLGSAVDVMERLGNASVGGAKATLKEFPVERHPEVLTAGFEIAASWPRGMTDLLDRLLLAFRTEGKGWGGDAIYRRLIAWGRENSSAEHGRIILESIYVHQTSHRSMRSDWSAANFKSGEGYKNLAQLAKVTGRTSASIKSYLRAMGLEVDDSKRARIVPIDKAVFDEIVALHADSVTKAEVAQILGTDDVRVSSFVAAGLLAPVEIHSIAIHKKLFSRAEAVAFRERIGGSAPVVKAPPLHYRRIKAVARHYKVGTLVDVIKLVMSGDLKVEIRTKKYGGFDTMWMNPPSPKQRSKLAPSRENGGEPLHNLKQAGSLLQIASQTLKALSDAGFIAAHKSSPTSVMFGDAAIQQFLETYVTSVQLASTNNVSRQKVAHMMKKSGVKAIRSCSDDPRIESLVYRREDIPTSLFNLPVMKKGARLSKEAGQNVRLV